MVEFVARINAIIINPILALIFVAALFYFLWGVFVFILKSDEESAREEGRQHMLWGIVGMVIMISVYAILELGLRTFEVTESDIPAEVPLNIE